MYEIVIILLLQEKISELSEDLPWTQQTHTSGIVFETYFSDSKLSALLRNRVA